MKWQEIPFGTNEIEIIDGDRSSNYPKDNDFIDEGIPFLSTPNIIENRFNFNQIRFISEGKFETLRKGKLKYGDLVLTTRGSIGNIAFWTDTFETGFINAQMLILRADNENVSNKFLYYSIVSPKTQELLKNIASGTAQPQLPMRDLKSVKLKFPPIETKKRIAEILSAYDDLIENNLKRIRLLEESARLLYREWFVRLKFPNHEHTPLIDGLPEGWERAKVGELIEPIKRKKKIPKDEYLESGEIPCVDQSTEFIGGFTDDEESKHTEPLPIIVFGDHTRSLKYIDFPFASGADGTQLIYPNRTELSPIYFFFALKEIDLSNYFYARHFKFLKDQEILVATEKLINEFSNFANKNFEQIKNLKNQNQKLKQARDLLLQRLMSGEIAV